MPSGFDEFGEVTGRKQRAELLDEGLDILTGLWRGQPFDYAGKHYTVKAFDHHAPPPPLQQPRIPIWVVGAWPHQKSMRRALRYDGLLTSVMPAQGEARLPTFEEFRQINEYVRTNRAETTPFDIIIEGETPGDDPEQAAARVRPWAEAGATWWIEGMWEALTPDPPLEKQIARYRHSDQ